MNTDLKTLMHGKELLEDEIRIRESNIRNKMSHMYRIQAEIQVEKTYVDTLRQSLVKTNIDIGKATPHSCTENISCNGKEVLYCTICEPHIA